MYDDGVGEKNFKFNIDRSDLFFTGGLATASAVTLTYGSQYTQQGATFVGNYFVSVISPERLINVAKSYSQAAAGVGIYGALGFTFATLLGKKVADDFFQEKILSFWNPKDETLQSLKGICSYLACSGIVGVVVSAILIGAKVYSASTTAALVGTALSAHLLGTLIAKEVRTIEREIKTTASRAVGGALIGTALVVGKALLGRIEVFFGLTPAVAASTYSAGAGLAALTLGLKYWAVKFFDTILATPQAKEYIDCETEIYNIPRYINESESFLKNKSVTTNSKTGVPIAFAEINRHNHLFHHGRNVFVEVIGSAFAGFAAYTIARSWDLVAPQTAKLLIGATLITQTLLLGLKKMTGNNTTLI